MNSKDHGAEADDGGDFFNYRDLHQVVCFLLKKGDQALRLLIKRLVAQASGLCVGSAGFQPVSLRERTAHHLMHGKYEMQGRALPAISFNPQFTPR